MNKSKIQTEPAAKKPTQINYEDDLFSTKKENEDEIESDGSANAFEETERVTDDDFDNLSEK